MIGLIHTASVYTPNGTTGVYDVVANAALTCRLTLAPTSGLPADDREERIPLRRLLWGPDYAMPETAQVEINSERWNVRAGSFALVTGPTGAAVYRRCDVARVI